MAKTKKTKVTPCEVPGCTSSGCECEIGCGKIVCDLHIMEPCETGHGAQPKPLLDGVVSFDW